jgi:hypothetical protein
VAGTDGEGGYNADEVVAAFARWAAAEQRVDAASARARQRWLDQQATEAATFVGLLVDLAEAPAVVTFALGEPHGDLVGRVAGVGRDFVVVEERSGRVTLVSLAAVDAVRVDGARPASTGDRAAPVELDLAGALAALSADRAGARLRLAGGQIVSGDLVGVGIDVAIVRPAGPARASIYVPLSAVLTCTPH